MRLILVPFTTQKQDLPVREALNHLGHRVDTVSARDWFAASSRHHSSITVLFMGRQDLPREQIIATLASRRGFTHLGLAHCSVAGWDTEILGACGEFCSWPCPEQELALRLARLCFRVGTDAGQDEEATLVEEFMALNLVGRSETFLGVLRLIKKLARCEAPVLIEGETGTGKELAAHAIHCLGRRHDHPFIPLNCGTLPDDLVENELFGHEIGAYTDAKCPQQGLVAQADGGTLFLDEIEALSPKGQVALLRFLQDHCYRPLGGKGNKLADVRVIAATNTPLSELVKNRQFRQDLFFRLNVLSLVLPALRARPDDVALLTQHFLRQCSIQYRQPEKFIHPEALRWMRTQPWPGNVRELENFVHREFLLAEGPEIRLPNSLISASTGSSRDSVGSPADDASFAMAKAQAIAEFERNYLIRLMAVARGNVSLAAKYAGKERRTLGRLLKKHGIKKNDYL